MKMSREHRRAVIEARARGHAFRAWTGNGMSPNFDTGTWRDAEQLDASEARRIGEQVGAKCVARQRGLL